LVKAKTLWIEKEVNFNVRAQDLAKCTNTRMRHSDSDWNRVGIGPNIYTDAAWKGIASPLNAGSFHKCKEYLFYGDIFHMKNRGK
jgi:hypothetical protein